MLQQVLHNTPVKHVITTQIGDLLPTPKRWIVNSSSRRVKKMVPAWRITAPPGSARRSRAARRRRSEPVAMTREDIAFLQYTGGTTGVSKGAMLTHRNILANMRADGRVGCGELQEGTEIAIAPLPLYHIFCLTATLSFMKWGSLIVLITNPRDMRAFLKELGRWKWSVMTGVNTLFAAPPQHTGFRRLDFSSLKVVVGGGAAVSSRWPSTGRR